MKLCTHRAEGFGPSSSIHPSLPTTCFTDVIIVPAASWIYILILLPVIILTGRPTWRRTGRAGKDGAGRHRVHRALFWIYWFLFLAMSGMISLEISRLAVSGQGVGLLPFVYGALLAELVIGIGWKSLIAMSSNSAFWAIFGVVNAVKLAVLISEQKYGLEDENEAYKLVDQITDIGVVVGLSALLAILHVIVWRQRRRINFS